MLYLILNYHDKTILTNAFIEFLSPHGISNHTGKLFLGKEIFQGAYNHSGD